MTCLSVVPYSCSYNSMTYSNPWCVSSSYWSPTCTTVSSWKPDPYTRVTQRVTNWSGMTVVPAYSYSRYTYV